MTGFGVLVRKELAEQWRTMRMPVALAVFACLGIASPVLARYTRELVDALGAGQVSGMIPPPTIADSYAQFVKNTSQLGVALAIIFAMGAVAAELERGTLAFIISKRVSRTAFVMAKWVALTATATAGVVTAAALTATYTAVLFAMPPPGFLVVVGAVLVQMLVFVSVTLAASTVTRSTVAAAGIGFGALLILAGLSLVPRFGDYTPGGMTAKALDWLNTGSASGLLVSVLVQVALIAASMAVAALALRRQDL